MKKWLICFITALLQKHKKLNHPTNRLEARYPIRPCGTIVLCAKQQSDLQEKEKKRKEKKSKMQKEKKRKLSLIFLSREKNATKWFHYYLNKNPKQREKLDLLITETFKNGTKD